MREMFGLTAAIVVLIAGASVLMESARPPVSAAIPAIEDFAVVDYLKLEQEQGPKATPRPVHVLASNPVKVFARTSGVVRLDVAVQLNGTDRFGVFSGYPDEDGFVRIAVTLPRTGSMQYVREPGPEGKRTLWPVPPGTMDYLVPTGILPKGPAGVSYGPGNEPAIVGDPVWVRPEE